MQPNPPCEPALSFQAIVEQAPDAVIFADREGTIRLWNRGAEAVFGFPAEEALGRSLDLIIPERLRQAHWTGMRRAIDAGRARGGNRVRTTRSLHKDGRRLYVDLSFGLIVDAAGAVVGAVAVGRDCTERYLADKAMRDRLALLEARPAS
jgi:PAS domain S-box-containing protein